ncbi:MAG: DciA family protein [Microbacteriaceae bacterium]|jgi:predicted nucleic acid-binding Zn ribbon protein|nr:MAG: hypothetical protein ABR66_05555 [Microbacteriaceae bacterium BACL25 MAG-120322-bin65]HAA78870.1 DUF721 domain-containing protein [Microbacteriaceae bacterium]|tara:strand:- start:2950 stop:3420 length:471 start_codon:yes stop_codon:yes gene_type:complete
MTDSEAAKVYRRLRQKFGGYRRSAGPGEPTSDSVPFGNRRDPQSFADAVGFLSETMGWNANIAQAELIEHWADIVGDDVAAHTTPSGCSEDILEIQCDSSAWATQLRLMKSSLLVSLSDRFPHAGISDISVKAPGAPSWKHGRRSVPGRGPRDTYG